MKFALTLLFLGLSAFAGGDDLELGDLQREGMGPRRSWAPSNSTIELAYELIRQDFYRDYLRVTESLRELSSRATNETEAFDRGYLRGGDRMVMTSAVTQIHYLLDNLYKLLKSHHYTVAPFVQATMDILNHKQATSQQQLDVTQVAQFVFSKFRHYSWGSSEHRESFYAFLEMAMAAVQHNARDLDVAVAIRSLGLLMLKDYNRSIKDYEALTGTKLESRVTGLSPKLRNMIEEAPEPPTMEVALNYTKKEEGKRKKKKSDTGQRKRVSGRLYLERKAELEKDIYKFCRDFEREYKTFEGQMATTKRMPSPTQRFRLNREALTRQDLKSQRRLRR